MRYPVVRRIDRLIVAVAVLIAALAGTARAQSLAALVTDAKGKVEIQRPGQGAWAPASVMTQVPEGSQVRVASGGHAALSFVKGGVKMRLTGPVTVRVDAGSAATLSGAPTSVQALLPGQRTAMHVPGGVNVDKMGGALVRGTAELVLLTGPGVLTSEPLLQWRAENDAFEGFRVVISDANDQQILKQNLPASARSYAVPAGKLTSGQRYHVTIRGATAAGADPVSVERDLVVLEPAVRAQIETARTEAQAAMKENPQDISPLVVLTWIYLDKEMHGDALQLAEKILVERPDARDAAMLLSRLYHQMGFIDKAMELDKKWGFSGLR